MEPIAEKDPESIPDKKKTNHRFVIFFVLLVLVGGTYGIIKFLHAKKHIVTDDAQIGALISPVIPHVSGYISKVYVSDNERVLKGDTLLLLDDRDFKVKLADAEAGRQSAEGNLMIAKAGLPINRANINVAGANVNTIDAQIDAAKVNIWRTNNDFIRYSNALKNGGVTQQQYDEARAAKQSAERQLDVLLAQKSEASKQTVVVSSERSINDGQVSAAEAMLLKSEAGVAAAKLTLSYSVITAEVDGQVSKVNLQTGQYVQEGQALFSIVPQGAKWVIANFKETQLKKMKIGQKVRISVDAFPDAELVGVVSSLSPASGAAQAPLPPDNASGNFVKVVQRVPVKIEFLHPEDEEMEKLSVGLNVVVDVLVDSLIQRRTSDGG
jgi:membrane fusion protein (multidrug efflux system)